MNTISAVLSAVIFFAVLYGAQSFGVTLPCGIILPSIAGGLLVGVIVK